MASWGTRRRNIIITIFILIVVFVVGFFLFSIFYENPTCFDGKQNGDEQGIDCGGSCTMLCTSNVSDPFVYWTRFFEIGPNIYNVIAYVENRNPMAGADNVDYSFRLYNREGVIIKEKSGTVDLKPNQITPIIENNLNTLEQPANRVTFNFTEKIDWIRQEPLENLITISDQNLFEVDGLPRVTANVLNNTLETLKNTKFVVIIYDIEGNAVGSSNTIIPILLKGQSQKIIFTWPSRFAKTGTRFEIIPVYDFGN